MDRKVYYGEYTLEHWIDLMLSGDIELPDYQRSFVWDKDNVQKLIASFKDDSFVPPITIGAFNIGRASKNLILDGQQRLSSLLLAYVQRFPKRAAATEAQADENDDEDNDPMPIINWKYSELLALGHDRDEIMQKTSPAQYETIDYGCSLSFFKKKRLGFSYIVPSIPKDKEKEQIGYYSTLFRNINIQGINLLKEESRKSLYFLDSHLEGFFNPQLGNYYIKLTTAKASLDFPRYLSLLSAYKKANRETTIAAKYKSRMESYYETYIYAVVNDEDSPLFGKFSEVFPNKEYDTDMDRLKQMLTALDIPHEYPSIIDVDVYMFGLIYTTVFLKRNIDTTKVADLKRELDDAITQFKTNASHRKSPSAQMHLRARIKTSITIFNAYAV